MESTNGNPLKTDIIWLSAVLLVTILALAGFSHLGEVDVTMQQTYLLLPMGILAFIVFLVINLVAYAIKQRRKGYKSKEGSILLLGLNTLVLAVVGYLCYTTYFIFVFTAFIGIYADPAPNAASTFDPVVPYMFICGLTMVLCLLFLIHELTLILRLLNRKQIKVDLDH